MARSTAVLWTGGKDSALALYRARDAGASIDLLATFVPEGDVAFHAHPISQMRLQAQALRIPHTCVPIRQPYRESYAAGRVDLRGFGKLLRDTPACSRRFMITAAIRFWHYRDFNDWQVDTP
jgi:diphthamide synthase (EF-2-diphthine--ammonia ligase)